MEKPGTSRNCKNPSEVEYSSNNDLMNVSTKSPDPLTYLQQLSAPREMHPAVTQSIAVAKQLFGENNGEFGLVNVMYAIMNSRNDGDWDKMENDIKALCTGDSERVAGGSGDVCNDSDNEAATLEKATKKKKRKRVKSTTLSNEPSSPRQNKRPCKPFVTPSVVNTDQDSDGSS